MSDIDPLKVMRNPETLRAYRQHQRALLAAAQPWLTIALVVVVLEIGLIWFALSHDGFGHLSLVFSGLTVAYGLCFLVATLRVWRYRRSHPLVLPEPPPLWSRGGKAG